MKKIIVLALTATNILAMEKPLQKEKPAQEQINKCIVAHAKFQAMVIATCQQTQLKCNKFGCFTGPDVTERKQCVDELYGKFIQQCEMEAFLNKNN
jgi:hypothetical protein